MEVIKIGLDIDPMEIPIIKEYYEEGIKKGIKEGIKKGIKKGIKEGIKKGIKEGIKEGIKKGIKEGIKKSILEIISNKFGKKECNEIKNTITGIDDLNKLDQILRMTIEFDNFNEFKDKLQIIIE
ncbi:MAG: hypothetical protein ACTSRP_08475 [Candidatus Helarchaeota archaeon]